MMGPCGREQIAKNIIFMFLQGLQGCRYDEKKHNAQATGLIEQAIDDDD